MIFVKLKTLLNVIKKKEVINSKVETKYTPTYKDLEKFIYNWNIQNPIDRYYRNKYNLRFNSPEHRALCLIDMALEYCEDKLFDYREEEKYEKGKGEFLKERKEELPSDEAMMEAFKNQDLSFLDDK
jgi:hypothetical protein